MVISGTSPDGRLVEFVELRSDIHPFFVATQAHPEMKSRPTRPHPLFAGFVGAAVAYAAAERLPVELPEPGPPAPEFTPHNGATRAVVSS
jgi:CTP synthase